MGREGSTALSGEERRKVFEQEQGAESVYFKGFERARVGYCRGGFLRVKDAGDAKGEAQRGGGKAGFAVCCRGGYGIFV